jgi:hypothetical protein
LEERRWNIWEELAAERKEKGSCGNERIETFSLL